MKVELVNSGPMAAIADTLQKLFDLQAEALLSSRTESPANTTNIGTTPPAKDDGSPFYKPAYFKQWHIGDELLRRNATNSKKYTPGKVRRQKQSPRTGSKGKQSTYWYSEPDVKRAWPERFATFKDPPTKA